MSRTLNYPCAVCRRSRPAAIVSTATIDGTVICYDCLERPDAREHLPRRPGRPRTHGGEAEIRIRMSAAQKSELDRAVSEAGTTIQDLVMDAIEQVLDARKP